MFAKASVILLTVALCLASSSLDPVTKPHSSHFELPENCILLAVVSGFIGGISPRSMLPIDIGANGDEAPGISPKGVGGQNGSGPDGGAGNLGGALLQLNTNYRSILCIYKIYYGWMFICFNI